MGSPVSFGDVVAMSKIAWNIGNAFSRGRKSAPAEFREVENQLHSLSSALAAFRDSCADDDHLELMDSPEGADTVRKILDNCNETLSHLQKIVEKYGHVTAVKDPDQSRMKRWSTELVKNYKKIAWTTEAGDLANLRSQLMLHTNSLSLMLGIINKTRTSRVEHDVKTTLKRLTEIHDWWEQNLKESSPPKSGRPNLPETPASGDASGLTLVISIMTGNGLKLLCPNACLHDNWENPSSPLFVCNCDQIETHTRLNSITLSPISFPFRQTGAFGSWTLYKALDLLTNQLVTININITKFTDNREFETAFVHVSAQATARAMLQQGVTNNLVNLSPDNQGIRLLNLQSDLRRTHNLVNSISFRVGHRSLTKDNISRISLLQFRELHQERARHVSQGVDYAELVVHYTQREPSISGDSNITRSVVHITANTKAKLIQNDTSIIISGVECFGLNHGNQVIRLESTDVTFQMTSLEAAMELQQRLEDMRMELFVLALTYPRLDETVILRLQATQVYCEVIMIPDAELLVTRDKTGKSRLIISSWNRCTVVSQDLIDDFFASANVTSTTGSSPRSFASSTWLVQIEDDCRRKVVHYPNGFKFLHFNSKASEEMFQLARNTLSLNEIMEEEEQQKEQQEEARQQLDLPIR